MEKFVKKDYEWGFDTPVEARIAPRGLNEETIKFIWKKKQEPRFMLDWRLRAYRYWLTMKEPTWANIKYPAIDYQKIIYYASPKKRPGSLEEVDPEIRKTYEKLGIPLKEQEVLSGVVAVDAIFDSVSVLTTYKNKLKDLGIIFCSISEAIKEHPELIRKYLGSVVPYTDNFFAALNSAVFSDGSFVFVPKGVKCPIELSSYFRMNTPQAGQFERTLIIAEEGSYVSYLEGCLPAGEKVSTGDNWVNIEAVKPGDFIANHHGSLSKVNRVMTRKYSGIMYKIFPLSLFNYFSLTSEHPVLAIKRKSVLLNKKARKNWLPEPDTQKLKATSPQFIKVKNLERGDFIIFPKIKNPLHRKISLTDEEIEFLGFYTAEGSVYYHKTLKQFVVALSFSEKEQENINRTKELIQSITGKKAILSKVPKKHAAGVTVYSEKLYNLCLEHCGKFSHQKKLSSEIMNLPLKKLEIFFNSYFKGDGNLCIRHKSHLYRCSTASLDLAVQLQEVLAKIGIYASLQLRKGGNDKILGRTITRKDQYIIVYTQPKKWSEVRETKDYFIVPIKKIERSDYDGYVFNLDIEKENSYLAKGFAVHNCSAPQRFEHQLHAAVVELIAHKDAEIRYATLQNWYPGDKKGRGGVYNFVTKRGLCQGQNSRISWTQLETGSAITWKYPGCILKGDNSIGEFYSLAITTKHQQADTGTKMIHLGKNTRSRVVSKSVSAQRGNNSFRGLVKVVRAADNSQSFSRCDALLIGPDCGAHTFPYFEVYNSTAKVGHEASTSRAGKDIIFYLRQRGLSEEQALALIVSGFTREILAKLPFEFAAEAKQLLSVTLEGSVG